MGIGAVGCCDNNTLKNSEISVQSVTYREGQDDFMHSPITLAFQRDTSKFQVTDLFKRVKQLRKIVNFQILTLNQVNSKENNFMVIKPTGINESPRQSSDGYVFFGAKYKHFGEVVNDVKLPLKEKDKKESGRFFMIFYNIKTSSYWVQNLNKGPGIFIKLDYALILKDGMIINIGNSYLVFETKGKGMYNPELEIKKLGDENSKLHLNGEECGGGIIIGRGNGCRVRIRDDSLSKQHATLKYIATSGWVFEDGDREGNKSTNGSWVYAAEEFEIYQDMFLKIGQIVMQAGFTKQ